jgi:5-methylcytosine-specific restriction enzyme subunit McrC
VKYKLYDDRKLSTGDIYQAFTYALALSRGRAEGRAGIVYPGERTGITRTLEINPTAAPTRARIVSASLDVRGILSEIGSDGSLSEYVRNEVQTIARIVAAGSALTPQNV